MLNQVSLEFHLLFWQRIDLRFKSLIAGERDLDFMRTGRNQQASTRAFKFTYMPHKQAVQEHRGSRRIDPDLDCRHHCGHHSGSSTSMATRMTCFCPGCTSIFSVKS